MSLSDEQAAFFNDLCQLRQYAESLGFKVTLGEVKRTVEQQRLYVSSGRSKTMNSRHLDGLAADLHFMKVIPPSSKEVYVNGLPGSSALIELEPIGKFWESLGDKNRWGGNFDKDWSRIDPWVDVPHFERGV